MSLPDTNASAKLLSLTHVLQEKIVSPTAQTWEQSDTAGSEMAAVSASTSVALTTENSNRSARIVWQIRTGQFFITRKIWRTVKQ